MKSLVEIVNTFFSGIEAYGQYDRNLNGDYYDGISDAPWEDPGKLDDFLPKDFSLEEKAIGYALFVAKMDEKGYGHECFYSDEVLNLGRKLLAVK